MSIKNFYFRAFFVMLFCACIFHFPMRVRGEENMIASGEITDYRGNFSGTLRYTIDSNGIMTITGSGPGCPYRPFGRDYDNMCPWNAYRDQIRSVVFQCEMAQNGTEYIGSGASINGWFTNCVNLESVYGLPEGITDLSATFLNCKKLVFVESIPATVKTMQYTFSDCSMLQRVPALPNGLADELITESIEEDVQVSYGLLGTFSGCSALETAPVIPENPQLYKLVDTFKGCVSMKEVKGIPENITFFQNSFYNCVNLQKVMRIQADDAQFIGEVFHNVASNNPYLLFIKAKSSLVEQRILRLVDNTSRIYVWSSDFYINFMVLNTLNNEAYGVERIKLNLQHGTNFYNGITEEYRLVNEEYDSWDLAQIFVPEVENYRFEGWYLDCTYTMPFFAEQLLNPDCKALVDREITVYAKMTYLGLDSALTINPNGGTYRGKSEIQRITEFEEKSFTEWFGYTGYPQIFPVVLNGNYNVELYGAQGGHCGNHFGGWGGLLRGIVNLKAGDTLVVNVGGGGQSSDNWYSAGGYNGGGDSVRERVDSYYDEELDETIGIYACCGGGGGATDIRLNGYEIWNRILVAGGGGGAGVHNSWNCRTERPDYPNLYQDDDDDEIYYEVYDRTIDGPDGQGGNAAAGGGGGVRGGAHNYAGIRQYGRINSSYGGTNGYDESMVQCLDSNYFIWGKDENSEYGLNGLAGITYRGRAYTPDYPVREGYEFAGWSMTGDGYWQDETIFMNLGGIELTANWNPKWCNLYFDAGNGKIDYNCLQYCKDCPYGINGNFPVASQENCDFLGWYTSPIGGERVTETTIAYGTGDITLYARYQSVYCLVSFSADNGVDYQPMLACYGENYGTLPVPEKNGHMFLGWRNDYGIVHDNSPVVIKGDHTLYAVWKEVLLPEIEGIIGESEWRNTPFLVNLDIKDMNGKGINRIIITVNYEGRNSVYWYANFSEGEVKNWNINYTIGNLESKEFEGVSEWKISIMDYYGTVAEEQFTVKLDFTPPEIIGNGQSGEMQYSEDAIIKQTAKDYLSGVSYFSILPGSMQKNITNAEKIIVCTEEPFEIRYNTDQPDLRNEGGYVLTAYDGAGNKTKKVIFTQNSIHNSILRVVPVENYQ